MKPFPSCSCRGIKSGHAVLVLRGMIDGYTYVGINKEMCQKCLFLSPTVMESGVSVEPVTGAESLKGESKKKLNKTFRPASH